MKSFEKSIKFLTIDMLTIALSLKDNELGLKILMETFPSINLQLAAG